MGEVAFVEVFTDDNGKSRGCGIIELESNDLVDIALEKMHRFDLNGRKIVVKEVRENEVMTAAWHGPFVRASCEEYTHPCLWPAQDTSLVYFDVGIQRIHAWKCSVSEMLTQWYVLSV